MDGSRILVIANETCAGRRLFDELASRRAAEILVIAPALNSRLRHLFADVDGARAAAEERLSASISALRAHGLDARGAVGDSDPVCAIEDALAEFDADEVIISTHPPDRSNWLERGVVERARERIDLPVSHVVVDLDRERAAAPR
ncbi:MAG: hypothetical protein ACJ740_07645 [Gaiellales bacterium]|jgi:hypothetical protein